MQRDSDAVMPKLTLETFYLTTFFHLSGLFPKGYIIRMCGMVLVFIFFKDLKCYFKLYFAPLMRTATSCARSVMNFSNRSLTIIWRVHVQYMSSEGETKGENKIKIKK